MWGRVCGKVRIKCKDGAFRVLYVVKRSDGMYVHHAFRKTTEKSEKRDIDLAATRYKSLDGMTRDAP